MLTCISDLLDVHSLAAVRETLTRGELQDGALTAAGRARAVKRNQQAVREDPRVLGASRLVEQALWRHPVFVSATRPRRLARLLLSRYGEGMAYGEHIDAPQIDGVRTDVSFTLFLNAPEDYAGGELVIASGAGEDALKLAAGSVVCYPSSYLHRVEPVTGGERLVAVGWLQSEIRSAEQRALLFEFDSALARLRETPGDARALDALANVRANLTRLWLDA